MPMFYFQAPRKRQETSLFPENVKKLLYAYWEKIPMLKSCMFVISTKKGISIFVYKSLKDRVVPEKLTGSGKSLFLFKVICFTIFCIFLYSRYQLWKLLVKQWTVRLVQIGLIITCYSIVLAHIRLCEVFCTKTLLCNKPICRIQ